MAIQRTTLECGCEIVIYGDGSGAPYVSRCPLHAHAEELLAALAEAPEPHSEDAIAWLHNYSRWWHEDRAKAIAYAEGSP